MTHETECFMPADDWPCICDRIARVRADERERAAERIAAAHNWPRGTDPSDRALWLSDAVAAARGGE